MTRIQAYLCGLLEPEDMTDSELFELELLKISRYAGTLVEATLEEWAKLSYVPWNQPLANELTTLKGKTLANESATDDGPQIVSEIDTLQEQSQEEIRNE